MADKCSIKRSVLGAMCKLGSNVKIINSVLMDGVQVQDGCHLQNSIVCNNAHLQVPHSSPPRPDVPSTDTCLCSSCLEAWNTVMRTAVDSSL